jgi:hypothetical protein
MGTCWADPPEGPLQAWARCLPILNQYRITLPTVDEWCADRGVPLSISMYESFGMNIGEAMANVSFRECIAFPALIVYGWPSACVLHRGCGGPDPAPSAPACIATG